MTAGQMPVYSPQVGFGVDFAETISIPFNSIRLSGRLRHLARKDPRSSEFWSDVLLGEVDGKTLLVKVYRQNTGGEKAFCQDLVNLTNDRSSSAPAVYGISQDTATPCILFSTSSLTSFSDFLPTILRDDSENALQTVWQLLIHMRNAGHRLLNDLGPTKADIICDAIVKAHVDDRCQIVLTPRTEGPATQSNDSIEELVRRAWAVVLQGAHLRQLRSLGYALDGNPVGVLDPAVSPTSFSSAQEAIQYLHKFWLPMPSRYLFWPSAARKDGRFAPGDFGIFDQSPSGGMTFRKIGTIAHELGGIKPTVQLSDFEEVKPNVFRVTCYPNGAGTENDLLKEGFMFSWSNSVRDEAAECDWWRLNARKLAGLHGVLAEDLVLVTKTAHGLDSAPLEHLSQVIRTPVHFQIRLDECGAISEQHWTFDADIEDDFVGQEVSSESKVLELPLPKIDRHFGEHPFPSRYVQLEALDLDCF